MGNLVSTKSHKKKKINKFSQDLRKSVPESTTSVPRSSKSIPESTKSRPESTKSVPQSSKSIPESTKSRPESRKSIPESTKSRPESRKSIPESTKSRPESRKSIPETNKNTIQESSNINGKKQVPPVAVTKLYIIYYSMYGHVERLAQEIKKGAETVEGIEATLWQIPETLPEEVLKKMHAPPRSKVPVIDVDQLPEADAFLFGFPTRFGMMPAQFKAFFDATGGIWREQKLAGKPAGLFHSTGSQGGGQETTAWTTLTILANHAMLYVPPGYTSGAGMVNLDVVKGGSPYGAGTIAGSGSLADKEPNDLELEQSFHQGKYTAAIAKKLKSTA